MRRTALRTGVALALGLGLVALPAIAQDSKPTPSASLPDKPPSFAGYVYITDVVGEVVKANDKTVTLRITWFDVVKKGGNNNNGRRNLSGNHRNFRNPFMPNMNRPAQVQVKEHHHDYPLDYLPQSLVRTKSLPPKTDDNGKKVPHTQKEIDELRAPAGVTGYAASAFDVTPGTFLEVILIRDKTIPAEKATEADLKIKYAIIHGRDPNPPKDIANGGNTKNPPKKKN